MKKASQFTIERPILDLTPPLPVGRGLNVQLEVHVLGQGGDDEVLPAPAAAVTVLIMTAIIIAQIYTLLCCILRTSSYPKSSSQLYSPGMLWGSSGRWWP